MEPSECYRALTYLIDKYVEDHATKESLVGKLAYDQKNREVPPAKHYLSELHKHRSTAQMTEEDGALIKDIAFHYV
jgi:hypothetical protein